MARASYPTDLSYRPIRASIAASLEDADDTFITDMCMLVAAIAERRHVAYLAALGVSDDRQWLDFLAHGQDTYRQEIQAMRAITATLTAAGLALGLSAEQVRARIDALICRELFAFPERQG